MFLVFWESGEMCSLKGKLEDASTVNCESGKILALCTHMHKCHIWTDARNTWPRLLFPFWWMRNMVIVSCVESISLICITIHAWPQIGDPVFTAIQAIYTIPRRVWTFWGQLINMTLRSLGVLSTDGCLWRVGEVGPSRWEFTSLLCFSRRVLLPRFILQRPILCSVDEHIQRVWACVQGSIQFNWEIRGCLQDPICLWDATFHRVWDLVFSFSVSIKQDSTRSMLSPLCLFAQIFVLCFVVSIWYLKVNRMVSDPQE